MTDLTFTRWEEEDIRRFAERDTALRKCKIVAAQDVGDKWKLGWRPYSPFIAMLPPAELDDELRYIANAAAALEGE